MPVDGLQVGIERLRQVGATPSSIAGFERSYIRLRDGDRGWLPECELEPLDSIPDLDGAGLGDADHDPVHLGGAEHRAALAGVAVVKLNGGLGTTMATGAAKGSLPVKPGLSFVDLATGHVRELRRRTGCELPLLFMNSAATLRVTAMDPSASFAQGMLPRLRASDLHPIDWPRDPMLEWAPAGHGAVFAALASSGRLQVLLDAGCERACISSVDNVAAGVDGRVASLMQRESIPFLMEVADRTEVDRKGGHLARWRGALVLRDRAQTPPDEAAAFHDIDRHRFFNTNTIWVDLRALDALLRSSGGWLDLPLIANHKRVDPYDDASPEVIQIESAMGAGISVFPDAAARRVGRRRFNPVKSTAELLAVRSDAYVLTDDHRLELVAHRGGEAPVIELDPDRFARQHDFDQRFPAGPPSLVECERLEVRGDVVFGADVVVRGSVRIEHTGPGPLQIADGSVLVGS